jgi:ribosomal protein L11 methyltransferase
MQWMEITITAHPEAVEVLSEHLSEITSQGVSIEEPYTLEDDGQRWRVKPDADVIVHAYLPQDEQANAALQRIETMLWHLRSIGPNFVGEMQVRTVDDEDWAETWKEHFHVTRIGKRIVIKPTWRTLDESYSDLAIIELDPGMAFGTGTHPTTRLCLEFLEDVVTPGISMLDVGTGSGILAIGAIRLGASHILGCDISSVAIRVAKENVEQNQLTDKIDIIHGTLGLSEAGQTQIVPSEIDEDDRNTSSLHESGIFKIHPILPYPLVTANIIARVIGELAETLYAVTAPDGILLASGIIADRADEALIPLQKAGFVDIKRKQEGDWIALIARRPL